MAQVISVWEQDPGSGSQPDNGVLVTAGVPDVTKPPLPTRIQGTAPPADNYPPGTTAFRYWACASALRRVADFWGGILGVNSKWNPTVGASLAVVLDEGIDLNAYYDRRALNFFHASVGGRMIYSGESPDIVCHEFGHAVLDAIRPQIWDVAAIEPPAFHESFGDISALLSALQLESVRTGILHDTHGIVYRSSRLSRLAEQLGWAIRQSHPEDVNSDCLRNAVNQLFYASPDALPTSAPATQLSSEPHSLSRVFTAGVFNALALMFRSGTSHTEADLLQVSKDLASVLVHAVRLAPIVPEYFAQVAGHMVTIAAQRSPGAAAAIKAAMVRHGILSVPGAVAASVSAEAGRAAFAPERVEALAAAADTSEPPMNEIDVSAYGLTVTKIDAVVAGERKRFGIAGAAPHAGDTPSVGGNTAALHFIEDLLRRGRLDQDGFAKQDVAVVDPFAVKTHKLVKQNDRVVLRRIRIDCGFRKNHQEGR